MALMDLKSDLSWYGKSAPGFKPNANASDTRFNNEGASPSVQASGYDNYGNVLSPATRHAADSFIIDDVTHSDRGLASRAAQLGNGSKFPISPEGNVHTFDLARTGFNSTLRYEDSFGVLSGNAGLANTYVAESPIDDMYNKFNLRDDATPNSGVTKQPFILRGIQREGSSDPQRWGLGETTAGDISNAIDLPRGGILTAGERAAIDVARIGKFLISPKGIGFLARQFGYQLMNPQSDTRVYDPLSAPGQVAVNGLLGSGKFQRHLGDESILGAAIAGVKDIFGITSDEKDKGSNIIRLFDQSGKASDVRLGIGAGTEFAEGVSSKLGGPGSLLGIGGTSILKRGDIRDSTAWKDQQAANEKLFKRPGFEANTQHKYFTISDKDNKTADETNTYVSSTGGVNEPATLSDQTQRVGNPLIRFVRTGGKFVEAENTTEEGTPVTGKKRFKTNTYDDIVRKAKDRTVDTTTINDFRTTKDYVASDEELKAAQDKLKDFDGGGKSVSANESGTEDVGKKRYKTNTYDDFRTTYKDRTVDTTTINDFRTTEDYILGDDELLEARKKLDNFKGPKGGGAAESDKSLTELGYYKLTTYDAIKSKAESANSVSETKAADNPSFTEDFKKGFAGSNREVYKALSQYGYVDYNPERASIAAQSDKVQANPFGGSPESDLIDFYFRPLRTTDAFDKENELIQFRAYINAINDSFAPGWDENQDQGRADAKIMLAGWSRAISLDFVVPIHSADEFDSVWQKLDELARLTYPKYVPNASFTGTYVQVTVGSLYKGVPMYVQDLSYDWDNETPWEIESGKQLPRYTNVSMTLGWIGVQRPEYNGKAFSYNTRLGGNV